MRGYKKSDFEKILNEIDLNKDEKIDFAEFKTMIDGNNNCPLKYYFDKEY